MNWGHNLTQVGAMCAEGWLMLATSWVPITTVRFAAWVRRHLLRVLRPGDIVIMDHLAADKTHTAAVARRGRVDATSSGAERPCCSHPWEEDWEQGTAAGV